MPKWVNDSGTRLCEVTKYFIVFTILVLTLIYTVGCAHEQIGTSGYPVLTKHLYARYESQLLRVIDEDNRVDLKHLKALIKNHPDRWTIYEWNGPSYESSLAQLFLIRIGHKLNDAEHDEMRSWIEALYEEEK